ncbi:unnamed protein product [Auanema sp. JU1783]|nr:unnamed protein product [Auanema sp. JU1783]
MTGTCAEVVRSILRNHCDGAQNELDYVELFLDFENAKPTEPEKVIYEKCQRVLESGTKILENAQTYGKGATDEVRLALQNPNVPQLQLEAANTVDSYVQRVKSYYELSLQLEELVPELLWDLCSTSLPPEEQLDNRQALATQLARIVDFVLQFDNIKMCTPALQNDFSYYRRSMKRNEVDPSEIELANQISLFLANSTPMLNTLSKSFINFVQLHPHLPLSNTTDTIATIVSVCRFMICCPDICARLSEATRTFCIRVMVGCSIVYDHIDESGIFARESPINIRGVVKVLKEHCEPDQATALINALKFTSKTFFSPTTPKWAKALLP